MSTRKPTRQQAAVSAKLDELDDFTSAQELHAQLRASGETVGLATVYRTLQNLAGDGTVDVLRTDDGEAIYRSCATSKHHHHLVCRNCGHTVEVEGPTVEQWADSVAAQHGFTEATHQIEIFGLCAQCSAKQEPASL
ncbi:transcriptional repressor [Dermacoccus abyssi]|uniref:Transcriptional repressor n=1 Tax=Dermacoccus abyssi TaxID=322596 RepID=A0ABX5Z9R6_9MICO|nr:transcriptional repressor [Dermacoccus abyssi]